MITVVDVIALTFLRRATATDSFAITHAARNLIDLVERQRLQIL